MPKLPTRERTQGEPPSLLISFVGRRDPWSCTESRKPGPVLSILEARPEFTNVLLLHTGEKDLRDRAECLRDVIGQQPGRQVRMVNLDIPDPTNYETILLELRRAMLSEAVLDFSGPIFVCAASGTPQFHACWLLLAASGELPARILHIREKRHVQPGQDLITEINPRARAFPNILPHIIADVAAKASPEEILAVREEIGLIGEEASFLRVLEEAARCASYDYPVLILGANGTGKEVVARFIHELSSRKGQRMVAVNCGAVPENLFESEFFGYRKGAFTGADRDRQGHFAVAHGGTLFLDEIGELTPHCQAKLLRALQEQKIRPLGDIKEIPVDVRIIAATNKNLEFAMRDGTFREDLYYRISITTLLLPSLNERPQDIVLLAQHLLNEFNRMNKQKKCLAPETAMALKRHRWKGNIRELDSAIKRAAMQSRTEEISPKDLSLTDSDVGQTGMIPVPHEGFIMSEYLEHVRTALLDKALEMSGTNQSKAARLLGVTPQAVQQYLKKKPEGS